LNTIIKAANVTEFEPVYATLFAKALEGKDVKDMLLNVGSGGGAAAPASGGAAAPAAGGAAAEETKEEEKKEEGELALHRRSGKTVTDTFNREGGVRRRYGLRSLRLSKHRHTSCQTCINFDHRHVQSHAAYVVSDGWKRAILENDGPERGVPTEDLCGLTRHARHPLNRQSS
jgi:ribosomal protein L12E/L44/L45/RPP1/RPP2